MAWVAFCESMQCIVSLSDYLNFIFYRASQVYHVTIMPCYDKKLEAARDDFVFSVGDDGEDDKFDSSMKIAEVDSVLTTGEVLELIQVLYFVMWLLFSLLLKA